MTTTPINKGQFALEPPERLASFERLRGSGCEDAYRENRRLWHELPERQAVSDYPLHVDLELASVCNLRCPMCPTITEEFKQQVNATLMDFALFQRLVDECAEGGVYSLRLSYRGESFLHPHILEACRYAKDQGIQEVSTLTNGLRLDEDMFTAMMEAGLDWLTISFDGLGEVYEGIRKPAKYERAVEKIANYARIKREAGRLKPVIKIQSVFPAIEADPSAYYQVFAPIADLVAANPLIDFMEDTSELPRIADFACPQIYQRLTIGADGTAMMCANDERNYHPVGDANTQTVHEIWHGARMTEVRDLHRRHQGCASMKACAHCYLPLQTYGVSVAVGEHQVTADKYVGGKDKLVQLRTPERYRRAGLQV
ncbi:MAG: radical SAM protein [Myxococcales bacterium]|nr:radical SAM protein [Myxococcales bacterium]